VVVGNVAMKSLGREPAPGQEATLATGSFRAAQSDRGLTI
jgi:hypothetical protein